MENKLSPPHPRRTQLQVTLLRTPQCFTAAQTRRFNFILSQAFTSTEPAFTQFGFLKLHVPPELGRELQSLLEIWVEQDFDFHANTAALRLGDNLEPPAQWEFETVIPRVVRQGVCVFDFVVSSHGVEGLL